MKLRLTPVTDPAVTILERFRSEGDVWLAETIGIVSRSWSECMVRDQGFT